MNKKYISIIICILLFIVSCNYDKKSTLFLEHIENNLSLNIKDKEINFLIYLEEGCSSCNVEFEKYFDALNDIIPENVYIIYVSKYPIPDRYNKWKNKYKDHLMWDRTDNIFYMNLRIGGVGRVIWKKNKIVQEKTFFGKAANMESFMRDF